MPFLGQNERLWEAVYHGGEVPFPEKSPIILPDPLFELGAFQSNLGGRG